MALAQAAREAEDLLLVYYTGHGLLDEDGLLHLALSSTDPGHVSFTGVPVDLVKRYLGRARARLRILVLDCCFSGRAVAAMAGSASLLSAQLDLSGTYTFTSTTATAPSHAPPGQRHTAFTAALLDALNQPEPLTLDDIHQHIDTLLQGAGLPRPQKRSVNAAGDIALVRGPAQPPGTDTKAATDGADEVRFRRTPPASPPADDHRDTITAVVFLVGIVTLTLVFGGWRVLLIGAAVVLGLVGLIALAFVAAERVRYELIIDGQGLRVHHGKRSACVSWADIECVGVLHKIANHSNVLIVRLRPGTPRPPGFGKGANHHVPDQRYVIVGTLATYGVDPVRLRSATEHFAGGIYRTDQQLLEMDPRLRR
ncbi:caspase family protein [Streptomyces sp. NPDC001544]|uniref:caspase, EACC1-associated type n=1 Tax=Streptomyces sp. NPDC001544 TaxID=3364584 RepID=UPI003699CD15